MKMDLLDRVHGYCSLTVRFAAAVGVAGAIAAVPGIIGYAAYHGYETEKAVRPSIRQMFQEQGYNLQSLESGADGVRHFDLTYRLTSIKDEGHSYEGFVSYDEVKDVIKINDIEDAGVRRSFVPPQP